MDLFTRCSNCDTVFRVTTRHLQASGGQVRCGRCEAVFDAFASLTAMPPGEDKALADASRNRTAGKQVTSPKTAPAEVTKQEQVPAAPETVPAEVAVIDAGSDDDGAEEDELPSGLELAAQPPGPTAADTAANLYEWEFKPAPTLARNRLWLGLSLLMLVVALVQIAYVFRTEILVNVPHAKPVYQLACRWLSCEIGLPRLAEQLHIDASDLQLLDPSKPNLVKLTALVRNRARVAVEYPAFELTLTNAREQVVARRVFLPAEYLAEERRMEEGLPGRQELSVSLYLDAGPLRAAGYRIYLFYPS